MPPSALEALEQRPELPARLRIEPGRRLVEEQQVGAADQRAGDREALLLSAGELRVPRASRLLSSSTSASTSSTVRPRA